MDIAGQLYVFYKTINMPHRGAMELLTIVFLWKKKKMAATFKKNSF